MTQFKDLYALYGGTFDPVHYGHLKSIEMLANLIGLKHIIIMPNNIPPHRPQPEASSMQRKKMLELAIANNSLFILDERELHRDSPSYTWQTLQEWRKELGPNKPLAFIIGQDSLLTLPEWYHNEEEILNNSHFIVCRRPGYPVVMRETKYKQWLNKYLTDDINTLYSLPSGKIYLAKTPQFNISATVIRQRLHQGFSCNAIPPSVLEYILQHGLYQKNSR